MDPIGTPFGLLKKTATRAAVLHSATLASAASAVPPLELLAGAPRAPTALQEQVAPGSYEPPSVKGMSTPEQIALAKHLKREGAKFYGAYWCTFCLRQRMMFGAVGSRALPYVECAEDAYQSQSAACRAKSEVTGYPTWEIGGQIYSGMLSLQDLQAISGFDASVTFPEYMPPRQPPPARPPPGGWKPPTIQGRSMPTQLALAKHLQNIDAKFYGAYWCRFCRDQRAMFGAEGARELPYVECASDGYQSATPMCIAKREIGGYPTWEISGKFYGGMRSLEELSRLSGFREVENDLKIDLGAFAPVRMGDDCALASGGADCK